MDLLFRLYIKKIFRILLYFLIIVIVESFLYFYNINDYNLESRILMEFASILSVVFPLIFIIPPIILSKYENIKHGHMSEKTIYYFILYIIAILFLILLVACKCPHIISSIGLDEYRFEFGFLLFLLGLIIITDHLLSFFIKSVTEGYITFLLINLKKNLEKPKSEKRMKFFKIYFQDLDNVLKDLSLKGQYNKLQYFINKLFYDDSNIINPLSDKYPKEFYILLKRLENIGITSEDDELKINIINAIKRLAITRLSIDGWNNI